jgi:hypothetical protein
MAIAGTYQRAAGRTAMFADAAHGSFALSLGVPGNSGPLEDGLRDLVRFETIWRLLLPLVEGLALFCEFDVTAVASNVIATPIGLATALFSWPSPTPTPLDYDSVINNLDTLLREVRTSPETIEAKYSLLVRALKASVDPYLAGYLTVKSTWSIAAEHCPSLVSSGEFLIFLRNFLFEDLEFVRLLLEGQISDSGEMLFASALATRLRDRLRSLRRKETYDSYQRYKDALESVCDGSRDPNAQLPPEIALLDSATADAGWHSLSNMLDDFKEKAASSSPEAFYWSRLYASLAERDVVVLDVSRIYVRVAASGICSVWSNPMAQIPMVTGALCQDQALWGTEGDGYMVMAVALHRSSAFLAAILNGHIAFDTLRSEVSPEVASDLRTIAINIPLKLEFGELTEHNITQLFRQGNPQAMAWPLRLEETVDDIYLEQSLYWLEKPKRDSVAAVLSEAGTGLSALLPLEKRHLFGCLVAWSLGAGLSETEGEELFAELADYESMFDLFRRFNDWAESVWHHGIVHVREDDLVQVAF